VKYYESPFIKYLIDIIDNYINVNKEFVNEVFNPASIPGSGGGDMNDILSRIVRNIESDLYTYFKKHILNNYNNGNKFKKNSNNKNNIYIYIYIYACQMGGKTIQNGLIMMGLYVEIITKN
jgi:hypothetical protein